MSPRRFGADPHPAKQAEHTHGETDHHRSLVTATSTGGLCTAIAPRGAPAILERCGALESLLLIGGRPVVKCRDRQARAGSKPPVGRGAWPSPSETSNPVKHL